MKAVKTILLGIATFALFYLMVAFILWDLNAGNWEERDRFLVVGIGGIISFGASFSFYKNQL